MVTREECGDTRSAETSSAYLALGMISVSYNNTEN